MSAIEIIAFFLIISPALMGLSLPIIWLVACWRNPALADNEIAMWRYGFTGKMPSDSEIARWSWQVAPPN